MTSDGLPVPAHFPMNVCERVLFVFPPRFFPPTGSPEGPKESVCWELGLGGGMGRVMFPDPWFFWHAGSLLTLLKGNQWLKISQAYYLDVPCQGVWLALTGVNPT